MEDRKAVVSLLMKECPTYMVKLIAEIRHLGWIKESPFLRSKKSENIFDSVTFSLPVLVLYSCMQRIIST